MQDLRCYTLHYFYKVIGTNLFNGQDGFIKNEIEKATIIPSLEEDNQLGEKNRINFAEFLKVPENNVIRITRDEYFKNVDEDE